LNDLNNIINEINNDISTQEIKHSEKISMIADLLNLKAKNSKIELKRENKFVFYLNIIAFFKY
jgi:hypothetical protein